MPGSESIFAEVRDILHSLKEEYGDEGADADVDAALMYVDDLELLMRKYVDAVRELGVKRGCVMTDRCRWLIKPSRR